MRHLLALALILGVGCLAGAQEKKKTDPPKKERPEPTLHVGDPAPAIKADKWLQGTPIKSFTPGNVYVVEFWATWCGPCIVMMPHMSEMQTEYRDRGVTFVGYTAKDPSNSEEKVVAFVKKRGEKLGYTFAYSDSRDTYNSWMQAAGRNGIPCCFVVDKKGTIAYIGHPMYLDVVMPKVVGGQWTKEDVQKLDEIEKDVNAVFASFRNTDADATLKSVADFDAKYPALSHIPYFIGPKISAMLRANKVAEAKNLITHVIEKAQKQEDPTALTIVSSTLRAPTVKRDKELTQMMVTAAEAGLKLTGADDFRALMSMADTYTAAGDKDKAKEYGLKAVAAAETALKTAGEKNYTALLNVANAHFAAGDKAKAREFGAKAVEAAPSPQIKAALERMTKRFDE